VARYCPGGWGAFIAAFAPTHGEDEDLVNRLTNWFFGKDDSTSEAARPLISFVVVVYRMPRQAENTLLSLCSGYQDGAHLSEYEVIVVENESSHNLSPELVASLPANYHYHLRENPESSPVQAINYGAAQAKGQNICIMIDGARMLTPGVIRNLLLGHRLFDNTVVAVPGYHLGRELQQEAVDSGYSVKQELELIAASRWPVDGYSLFDIACFSGSSAPGFYLPNSESNCLSLPRDIWAGLGGMDERFDMRGGGLVNLDLYKRACEYPGVRHVIIPGEGTFHQFHGGVTTGGEAREARDAYIEASKAQYRELRGSEFESPNSVPVYLGEMPPQVQKFLHYSSARVLNHRQEDPLKNPF
jgi:glycosyltransferase involved in cell wall biosynthesis